MPRLDPHSYNDSEQPSAKHLSWRARVDFARRTLEAEAELGFDSPVQGPLDLDTRDLEILGIWDDAGRVVTYRLGSADSILGTCLHIQVDAPSDRFRISYCTAPDASALQWLTPAQTDTGLHPFLFSQCQAIHARSVVPLQDTPRIRITYDAELTVPVALRGLMAAAFQSREERGNEAIERYQMRHPIPPYLFALAVGDLVSRDVGPRSRVWAEPSVVERAAWEFARIDDMLKVAEELFGPYDWDRFDVLTMPSSFPYGGMENPCLTFVTPTLLAGDRSLVTVLAHELAHSWTGNRVSNANAEHFWLNEGFTVFAERRILEVLEGHEMAALHAAIGLRSLEEAISEFAERPHLTWLHPHLDGMDPDEIYSVVPYEKGYLFLCLLEQVAGRSRFDRFLRHYMERYGFRSITTQDFVDLVEGEIPGVLAAVDANGWLYGSGIPPNAPRPRSVRMQAVLEVGAQVPPTFAQTWSAAEWQLYLEHLPHPSPRELCALIDHQFHLSESRNAEILFAWLTLAACSGYDDALPRIESALGEIGRMKFLKPLYRALSNAPATRDVALRCFERYSERYHPIARQVLGQILGVPPIS